MNTAGGQLRRGARGEGRLRTGAVATLGAALAIAMATSVPVWADNPPEDEQAAPEGGADQGDGGADAPAEGTAPVDEGGDPGTDDGAEDGSDEEATEDDHDHGSGGGGYGGRATGPADLITLPDDPDYPVPAPPTHEALPEEVDAGATFQRNVICDPVTKPGVIALANLLSTHYDRPAYSLSRACIDQRSEHYDGRAVDWVLDAHDPHERRIGDAAVTWLTDNDGEMAHRLGIQSIIWNERSWGAGTGYWQAYAGQSPHTDHIHISLTWDGAAMRTSWWTGIALEEEQRDLGPCDVLGGGYSALPEAPRTEACVAPQVWPEATDYGTIRPDGQGPGLDLIQPLLDVPETGVLDSETRAALLDWQAEQGIPTTGVLDQLSYAAALEQELPELPDEAFAVALPDYLVTEFTAHKRTAITEGDRGEAVEVLQAALGMPDTDIDGVFGPLTAEALTEFAAEEPLLRDDLTTTDTLVWEVLERRTYPLLMLRTHELEVGDEGDLVVQLQQLLDVDDDGVFGPQTQQAVEEAQATAELEPTGVVDGDTWQALEEARLAEEAEQEDADDAQAEDGQAGDRAEGSQESGDDSSEGEDSSDDEGAEDEGAEATTPQWSLVPVR